LELEEASGEVCDIVVVGDSRKSPWKTGRVKSIATLVFKNGKLVRARSESEQN
jgi:hypothetical protein